jgi:hypothetical protein
MFKVTRTEEYAVTTYYACTIEDSNGKEFEFTLEEIYNNDTGDLTNIITWVSECPDEFDEEDIIDMCYDNLSNLEDGKK